MPLKPFIDFSAESNNLNITGTEDQQFSKSTDACNAVVDSIDVLSSDEERAAYLDRRNGIGTCLVSSLTQSKHESRTSKNHSAVITQKLSGQSRGQKTDSEVDCTF